MFGVINVFKPAGMTSRDVVNRIVRRCPRKTKVGHAGTLDPMATGVLVVAIGPATKLIQYVQSSEKKYVGSFRFGFCSDTEDITGQVREIEAAPQISERELTEALGNFVGQIQQTPPQFSAVKVDGQRAYKAARQGQKLEIKARPVRIDSVVLTSFKFPDFQLKIQCGKGTYVRTLGRDIAKSLGSDSVMTALQRTAVGNYTIESSQTLEQIESRPIGELISSPGSMVCSLASVVCYEREISQLLHGKRIDATGWNVDLAIEEVAAYDSAEQLLAVLKRKSTTEFGAKINFVPHLHST